MNTIEEKKKEFKSKVKKGARTAGYIGAIVVNIILIYIFNHLLDWQFPWLNNSFIAPLWIFNLSFAGTILFNVLYLIYDGQWFRTLGQLILNCISLSAVYTLYFVFPFNASGQASANIKIVLLFVLFATGIGIIVEAIKLLVYLIKFIHREE